MTTVPNNDQPCDNPDRHRVKPRCYLCGSLNVYDGYWVQCPNRCAGSPSAHYGRMIVCLAVAIPNPQRGASNEREPLVVR